VAAVVKKVSEPEEIPVDTEKKILTLLQFARKAGKLVHGFEACKNNMLSNQLKLMILTEDLSKNTVSKIIKFRKLMNISTPIREYGTQEELSNALGFPWTGIIGVLDNNFAGKILSYFEGDNRWRNLDSRS